MPTISRRERSLIGLGVAGAVLFGGYLLLVEPFTSRNAELSQLVPAREATLERRRQLIAQRDKVAAEQQALASRLEAESARLLPGATAPLAASELQKLVKEVADGAKVEVRSERVLPPVDMAGLQEVPIEIAVAGNVRETVALLHNLEQTPRLLTLRDVNIRVVAVGQARDLLTTLTVSGYVLPGSPVKPEDKAPVPGPAPGPAGPVPAVPPAVPRKN
jgi:Tfp pilus assembly protein PilO